jgi:hypothetical protein
MMGCAANGALQQAEIAFDRIGMPEIGAGVFIGAVVSGESATRIAISPSPVSVSGAMLAITLNMTRVRQRS